MDSYIILTPEIGNMGGGQMYTNNKVRYLKEHGWNVHVFYFKEGGSIMMPYLKEYYGNVIPEFRFAFYYVPILRRNKIAKRIKTSIVGSKTIIIESQLIDLAFWGEDIAKRIGAKHIVNFIEEQVPVMNDRKLSFFEYKLKHWHMLNAGERSQKRIFKDKWKEEYVAFINMISYKCSNVVYDVGCDIQFKPCDFSIISIGRLDKPYVESMTSEFIAFAEKHKNKKINFIYVGGSPDGIKEREIPKLFQKAGNATVYMMGYTFPVPLSVVKQANVAVASANSILVTSDLDIPTISLDMNDHQVIGVYGYNTINKFLRNANEPALQLSSVLDEVLIYKKYPRKGIIVDSMKDVNEEFDREIEFLSKSKSQQSYFDLSSLTTPLERGYCQIKWSIHQVMNFIN